MVEQFNFNQTGYRVKNSLKVLTELKTDRALSLSLDNNILTETRGDEYIFGLGYRLKDIPFTTNIGGRRRTMKGDLNVKADLSYRDNITILRSLNIDNNQVTAGQTLWSIKVTADYMLSRNLTALFFYDHNFSKFAISTAFLKLVFVREFPFNTILGIKFFYFKLNLYLFFNLKTHEYTCKLKVH